MSLKLSVERIKKKKKKKKKDEKEKKDKYDRVLWRPFNPWALP